MRHILLLTSILALCACSDTLDRLNQIGKPPPLSKVENPTTQPHYQPISWPLPQEDAAPHQYANSLWQQGSRTFFRDQRAARVGDLLKVVMKINDKGKLEDKTDRARTSGEAVGLGAAFGMEKIVPGQKAGTSGLLDLNGNSSTNGTGKIERKEEINTQLAATVIQVLPNGNFVIDGTQEIRINDEVREISVQGVVRPQDIGSDNTIDYSQIAEARIAYGGRGNISELQRPRWGHEAIEVLSPF